MKQKSLFFSAIALVIMATIMTMTFVGGDKDDVQQLVGTSLNTALNPGDVLGAAIATPGKDVINPQIDMTPIAVAIEKVGEKSDNTMNAFIAAISGQNNKAELDTDETGWVTAGVNQDTKIFVTTKLASQYNGDKKVAEAILLATGKNPDYFGDILVRSNDKYFKIQGITTGLAMANEEVNAVQDEVISKNTAGVKTFFDITLAGDKKYTPEERKVLAQWSYDSREGMFIDKAAQTERDDFQKSIKGAYASAAKAKKLNARLQAELDSRFPANFHVDAADKTNPILKADSIGVKAWN